MDGTTTGAWSTLRILLPEKNLTVVDLHEKLRERGLEVNIKSLYRLATSRPIRKIDTIIVRAICQALDVSLEDLIQFERPKFHMQHLDRALEKELNKLMDKNNEGQLTQQERARFYTLLQQVQKINLHNSRVLVDQKKLRESKRTRAS